MDYYSLQNVNCTYELLQYKILPGLIFMQQSYIIKIHCIFDICIQQARQWSSNFLLDFLYILFIWCGCVCIPLQIFYCLTRYPQRLSYSVTCAYVHALDLLTRKYHLFNKLFCIAKLVQSVRLSAGSVARDVREEKGFQPHQGSDQICKNQMNTGSEKAHRALINCIFINYNHDFVIYYFSQLPVS